MERRGSCAAPKITRLNEVPTLPRTPDPRIPRTRHVPTSLGETQRSSKDFLRIASKDFWTTASRCTAARTCTSVVQRTHVSRKRPKAQWFSGDS